MIDTTLIKYDAVASRCLALDDFLGQFLSDFLKSPLVVRKSQLLC